MDNSTLAGINDGLEAMYDKYRDIDEDELLAQLSPEELAMLNDDLEKEFGNPSQVTSWSRPQTNWDIDEEYDSGADQALLEQFLSKGNQHVYERQVPDHIRYLQDPNSFRPVSPSEYLQSQNNKAKLSQLSSDIEEPFSTPKTPGMKSTESAPTANGRNVIDIEFFDPNSHNIQESDEENNNLPYRTQEEADLINSYKKQEMLAKHGQPKQQAPEQINLNIVQTRENVKYENDPTLRFQPNLRKASPTRTPSLLPQQTYNGIGGDDDEEINSNVPEEMVRRVAQNDPELTEVNLNNIIGVPEDLFVALAEAMTRNTYVTKVNISNTGIRDRVAKAFANVVKRNPVLQVLALESNFITGDGAVSLVKALQINETLRELRIDNQRHIFGQNVEQEFAKRLNFNKTLTRFGYSFANPGLRMSANNLITRNVDYVRKQRVMKERSEIASGQVKPKARVKPGVNRKVLGPSVARGPATIHRGMPSLPKMPLGGEDKDIAAILSKLGNDEMLKLQSWLAAKTGDPGGFSNNPVLAAAPGGPPPPPNQNSGSNAQPKKVTRKAVFEELKSGSSALRNVQKPQDQKIVLPDPDLPMPEDEKNRGILGKGNNIDDENTQQNPVTYDVKQRYAYKKMNEAQYNEFSRHKIDN